MPTGGEARPNLVTMLRGADAVAHGALTFRRFAETASRALINGVPGGVAWSPDGSPFAVVSLTVVGGRVASIDILADPERLARLDLERVAG